MRLRDVLISGLLASGLLAPALRAPARAECRLDRIAALPIVPDDGRIEVEGHVNNQPARFVFDTGARTTALSEDAATRLGLKPLAPEHGMALRATFYGIGGARRARPMQARNIDLGGLRARDFAFFVIDMPMTVDGLLSADLVAKYDIDLDLPGGAVRLFYPEGDCSHPAAFLHGPLYSAPLLPNSQEHSPRVNVTVGGRKLTALIDTGAPGIALFRGAAERLGLVTATSFDAARHTAGGIGPTRVRRIDTTLTDVAIGDLSLDRLPAFVLDSAPVGDEDMILGRAFMQAIHVWISYSSGTLVMQVPPTASPVPGAH